MKSYQKDLKQLIQTLNIVAESIDIEYKMIYEYRYFKKYKKCFVNRKITAFRGHTPVLTKIFKNDLEVIQYICDELEKYDSNGKS